MENKRVFAGGLIAGAVLTLAVGGCAFVGVTLYQGTKNGSSLEEVGNKVTMEKVNVLEGMIDDYYLEDVSAEDLEQGVYKGLLDALGDPYSVFIQRMSWKRCRKRRRASTTESAQGFRWIPKRSFRRLQA